MFYSKISSRLISISVCIACLGLAGLWAADKLASSPQAKPQPLIRSLPDTGDPSSICPALDARVNINVENVPFQKLIEDFFVKKNKLNVVVDWAVLEEDFSNVRHTKITLNWKNVTLAEALKGAVLLGGANKLDLGYRVDNDGVVYISDKEHIEVNDAMMTRYYDCYELLRVTPSTPSRTLKRVTQTQERVRTTSSSSSSGDSLFDDDSPEDREEDLLSGTNDSELGFSKQLLISLITTMVDKDCWDCNGGVCQIIFYGRTMVVETTSQNHQAILTILEHLRAGQLKQRQTTPIVVQAWWIPADRQALIEARAKAAKDPSQKITAAMLDAMSPKDCALTRGYNNTSMTLMSGAGHLLVSGVEPVVSDNAAVMAPVMSNLFFGTAIDIKATLNKTGQLARVTVDSEVSTLRELIAKPVKETKNSPVSISQPQYTLGGLKTAATIPVGQPALLGGYSSRGAKDKKAAEPMLLFVQVSLASDAASPGKPKPAPNAKASKLPAAVAETPTQKIEALLRKPVDFTANDVSLIDIFEKQFPKQFGVNVFTNWRKLEEIRRNLRNKKITVSLTHLPLSKVLEIVLKLAGGDDLSLGYYVQKNGMISIEELEKVLQKQFTRFYSCGDLLLLSNLPSKNNLVWPSNMLESDSPFSGGDDVTEGYLMWEARERLVDMVTSMIDKDSWDCNGGTCQIAFRDRIMVVKNSQPQQWRIASMLENLRQIRKTQATTQAVRVHAWWVSADAKTLSTLKAQGDKLTAQMMKGLKPEYEASALGVNRRTMILHDGEGRKLVVGAEPVVSDKYGLFSEIVENVFFGAAMYITPRLDPRAQTAEISVCSQASVLQKLLKQPLLADGKTAALNLDLPVYAYREMNTHTTIPVGRPVLLGGFAAPTDGKNTAAPLLLFVQVDAP